ncbi:MAG: sigma-70 family RNA polymerase sigma factor [Elusimicrobia bacterium]|nr:sigma-70 family RNA polymerase sigma factor [Elusimicrobiota bacterium]
MDMLDPVKLYFSTIKKIPKITRREIEVLSPKIAKGDKNAKKRMIEGNLRLVVPIARKYYKQGISFSDLIEEGNLGLIRSIEKFDIKKGYYFSTYATFWITQYISRYVSSQLKTIRIPEHIVARLRKWLNEFERLKHKLGRKPTPNEIAKRLKLSPTDIIRLLENLEVSKKVASLDMKIDEDQSISLSDVISDGGKTDPTIFIKYLKITKQVGTVLDKLSLKERKIIIMRFGLEEKTPHTLEEVGKIMNLSRERIRQIEGRAFSKIKQAVLKLRYLEKDEM